MPTPIQTYEQAIEYLFGRINYERAHSDSYSASDFKLDRMRHFLQLLGDPQDQFPAVHIAGTKGKGSTAVMCAEILKATGRRVGLFTSPHVHAFEERMKVNGVQPSQQQLVELINSLTGVVDHMDRLPGRMNPTYFEIATALAWMWFSQQHADWVVLEVGLGGRLDATNLCTPQVCAITSISRDHTKLLGSRLSSIATEKAGIAKPNVPLISGHMEAEAIAAIDEVCTREAAPHWQLGRDITYRHQLPQADQPGVGGPGGWVDVCAGNEEWTHIPVPLCGTHQARNTALAVGVMAVLKSIGHDIPPASISAGLHDVHWPLRVEVVSRRPTVVVDAAHNWASINALLQTLDDQGHFERRILVFATSKDKDAAGMLRTLLPRFDTAILTSYLNNPRALPTEDLYALASAMHRTPVHLAANPAAAWKLARRLADDGDLICVTGSFFIAAEVRELLIDEATNTAPVQEPVRTVSS